MGTDWSTTSQHTESSAWQGALDVVGGPGRRVGCGRSQTRWYTRFECTWTRVCRRLPTGTSHACVS
jgi:hypothetical protein